MLRLTLIVVACVYVMVSHAVAVELDQDAKQFWSYQRVTRPGQPEVKNSDWVRTPVDRFVLRRLEDAEMTPSASVEKTALLRRAYYDLIGLPPSPDEIEAFLADQSPNAFESVVDHLLESPYYGERWARHWLDVVRYAESDSYERDGPKPFVWRYRDYVIRSFNEDKPYDRFIIEQLAGDELDEVTPEAIIATGYYRVGVFQDEPVDHDQELYEDLDDILRTTSEVFLGVTLGCARCHDHKLDPIPQRDYYRFMAFFHNIRRYGVRSKESIEDASLRTIASEEERRIHDKAVKSYEEKAKLNTEQLAIFEEKLLADLAGVEKDEWKTETARIEIARKRIGGTVTQDEFDRFVELSKQRDGLRKNKPRGLEQALCVKEHGREAPPTYILGRGNVHAKGDQVQPGFPAILSPQKPEIVELAEHVQSSGRRLVLAKWIASPENPLTARVMVNRIWQHHFGRGIVRTPNDFGFQGAPPTHPDLLDWLASEFVAGGWQIKRIHKLIMISSAYQMSSFADERSLAKDPENELFWRFNARRLAAEEIRDSILAVNGSLNISKMFGPSVYPLIPDEVKAGQSNPGHNWEESSPEDRARRSIYIHIKRSLIVPIIANFDGPDTDASCPIRFSTTQPTQSLGMLNSAFINKQSVAFGDYLRRHAGTDVSAQVSLGLHRATQRTPTGQEIEGGVEFIKRLCETYKLSKEDALHQFCLLAFNLNEFLYLD